MKKVLPILALAIAFWACNKGVEKKESASSHEGTATHETKELKEEEKKATDPIEEIRKKYATIKKATYDTVSFTYDCQPFGGKLIYHRDGDQLRMIEHIAWAEHGESKTEYCYWDGQVFFIFDEVNYWRFTGEEDPVDGGPVTIDVMEQKRYYFKDEKAIRCLKKTAEGSHEEIRTLISKAANTEETCDVESVVGMAKTFQSIKTVEDATKKLCDY